MRFNFTNHHRTFGKDRITIRNNSVRKLVRTILFLSILCITSLKAKADWWTDSQNGYDAIPSAGSRYQVSYNISNGVIHIESWAFNSRYFFTVYPNSFNSTINISADLRGLAVGGSHEIQMSVVDLAGRLVWSGPIQKVSGTGYKTTWNGENADGTPCRAGVYFIRMMVNGIPHIYKVIKQ